MPNPPNTFVLALRTSSGTLRSIDAEGPIFGPNNRALQSEEQRIARLWPLHFLSTDPPEGHGLWLWEGQGGEGAWRRLKCEGAWRRLNYLEAIYFALGTMPWEFDGSLHRERMARDEQIAAVAGHLLAQVGESIRQMAVDILASDGGSAGYEQLAKARAEALRSVITENG